MPLSNAEVAATFSEVADLLDLLGERFKPEAYRRAARSLEALPESVEAFAGRGELRSIPGVGEAIAEKLSELLRTGKLAYLERLRAEVPSGVLELMRLPGVGPKTARRFWVELGISGPSEISAAIAAGRLGGVKGFGERKIELLRSAVGAGQTVPTAPRRPIESVWPVAEALVRGLREVPGVRQIALAGSFRRSRETVGDLDVLVTSDDAEAVFDAFSHQPQVREVRLRGPTKETVLLEGELQVDLRVVEPDAFGAALQYFTGSKDHNVRLRALARERGLKVNEYGVYRGEERVAGRTEEEVYAALGLAYIPPELREDRGEIDAAAKGRLPRLIEREDLVSDLHVHLPPGAGTEAVERLAKACASERLAEVGVVVAIAGPGGPELLVDERVLALLSAKPRSAPRLVPVLEAPASALASMRDSLETTQASYVIARGPAGEEPGTPRAVPQVRLLAHVGGSVESSGAVLQWASEHGCAVEVGPGPERFDSVVARLARERGVPLALPTGVGPDDGSASGPVALGFARRAGATPADVANANGFGAGSQPIATPRRRGRPKR